MTSRESAEMCDAINKEFGRKYPYLRLALMAGWSKKAGNSHSLSAGVHRQDLVPKTIDISDSVRVIDLESALEALTGLPVQTLRKNGAIWLKISHTNHWTLKEQNDRGQELDSTPPDA